MIRIGLVGCGDIAESGHLPTILDDDRFNLVAVCDLNLERAKYFASRAHKASVYGNWQGMLAEQELDGVVIALPPETSPDVAEEALLRNLAVLDEKPLASTLAEGRRLKRAVEKSNGVYQVGFALRYGDWVGQIGQWGKSLGLPLAIYVNIYDERHSPDDHAHFSRIQSFLENSSAITHEGSHVVDYVNLWNPSQWTRVRAFANHTSPELKGPNEWSAQIDYENLSTLHMKVSWLLTELPSSTVTLVGPEGRLDFNCDTGRGHVEICGEKHQFTTPPLAPEWSRQYHAFAEAYAKKRASSATVEDGVRAIEITSACELSRGIDSAVTPSQLAERIGLVRFDRPHRTVEAGKERPESRVETE